MAIYHCSAKTIGRSSGSSVVNSAAYRSGEKLYDEKLEKTFYYAGKAQDVMHKEIMAPENVPEWVHDREKLWNAVEAFEKRKDSQLAREIEISLPREFSTDQNVALVREYVQKEFVNKGMVADVCLHYGMKGGEYNPHAHVLLTMREITAEGFGKKNVEWNKKELLKEWRQSWSELSNKHLSINGFDVQIDHRSLKEQGIELTPQNVELPNDAKERLTEQRDRQIEIMRQNGARLIERPEIALKAITHMQATFRDRDIARYVHSRTADKEQFDLVCEKIKQHDDLVKLAVDRQGTRYTTKEMLSMERAMFDGAMIKAQEKHHLVGDNKLREIIANHGLSIEQQAAVEYITQGNGVRCIVGYAGTGKTHMLKAAREIWEQNGYQVQGGALSGIAAQGLEQGAGINSRTVARRLIDWENGRDQLSSRDILVIDEAGMLGTKDVARLVNEVKEKGAKLVLIGDPQQLQAIEAGAAFRGIAERIGYLEMNNIRRQEVEWQREATKMLALGQVGVALDQYSAANKVHMYDGKQVAMDGMVIDWMHDRQENPQASQIMLAYKRQDVRELNAKARQRLKDKGQLSDGYKLELANGMRELSIGDRVYFLKNDNGLAVKNGTLGEVVSVNKDGNIKIKTSEYGVDREIAFSVGEYNHIDHGYAATVHKAQGVTVDKAYVMASQGFNQHITYVAISRHIRDVSIYWAKEEFSDFADLKNKLGRAARKDNAIDYWESARVFAENRGMDSNYRDIELKNVIFEKEQLQSRLEEKYGERVTEAGKDLSYSNIIGKLEQRRVLREGMQALSRQYGLKVSNDLQLGEKLLYKMLVDIGGEKYGLLQTYVKQGISVLKVIKASQCIDLRANAEVEIGRRKGSLIAQPSPAELRNRRVESLQQAFGKKISFMPEAGDWGRYGGVIEFEGKKYGVMHQYDQVKLIERHRCWIGLKDGDYMKIEEVKPKTMGVQAVLDSGRQAQAQQMELQKQLEISKSRSKDFGMEI